MLFFFFPSLPVLELLTRYQLQLAPFCSLPVSQFALCAKKILEKPVEEAAYGPISSIASHVTMRKSVHGLLFFHYGYGALLVCPSGRWSSTMHRLLVLFINSLTKESSLHIQGSRKFSYFWYTASGVSVHHLIFLPTCDPGYCKTKADL